MPWPFAEPSATRGLDYWRAVLLGCRARLELDAGRWAEAADAAALALRDPSSAPVIRVLGGVALGLVRARRGDPGVWAVLDSAFADAEPTGEAQQLAPALAARAEAAWLEGRSNAVVEMTERGLETIDDRGTPWEIGELACWRWRAGVREEVPRQVAEPYALEMSGDWVGAARRWRELGCPYEAALARSGADDDAAVRDALGELQSLGAQPAAAIVTRRLRERGVRRLPRGPRATTKQNAAGLTAREVEVLRLLADGLRNADIAERLFLSEKTVDHHVSAILRKLGARTRGEASAEAQKLGILGY